MAEPGSKRETREPGLAGIDLPGMEVEYAGLAIDPVHATKGPAREAIGQQSEVATTAAGQGPAQLRDRGFLDLQ